MPGYFRGGRGSGRCCRLKKRAIAPSKNVLMVDAEVDAGADAEVEAEVLGVRGTCVGMCGDPLFVFLKRWPFATLLFIPETTEQCLKVSATYTHTHT